MAGVAERVIAILARQALLEPSDIAPDDTPDSLGLDSLGLVEAIFAIEEAFGITVPFSPNEPEDKPGFDVSSVARLISEVERLIAAKGAPGSRA